MSTVESIASLRRNFFFNDTATTEIYTLSLHDALPIFRQVLGEREELALHLEGLLPAVRDARKPQDLLARRGRLGRDRKSTRLNSSHQIISYAVFCLKKKTSITT